MLFTVPKQLLKQSPEDKQVPVRDMGSGSDHLRLKTSVNAAKPTNGALFIEGKWIKSEN